MDTCLIMRPALLWGVLISIMLITIPMDNNASTPEKIPRIVVDTKKLSPFQIGSSIGYQTKALFPDIEQKYDAHLSTVLSQFLFDKLQNNTIPYLLKKLDSNYQAEMKGITATWMISDTDKLGDGKLSLNEYTTLNLLADLGFAPNGTGFGVLSPASENNSPIIGRNMDWLSSPALRSLQAITIYQNDDKAIANIGFAGISSFLTGFNNQGVFLSLYSAEPDTSYQNIQLPLKNILHLSSFELRKALEKSDTIKQTSAYLSKKHYAYSNSILMADKKSILVLEYAKEGKIQIRKWDSQTQSNKPWNRKFQIAVVGCHVLKKMPYNCNNIKDGYQWDKLRQLATFSSSKKANERDIANIMFNTDNHLFEIFNQKTLQSLVYLPENNHLYLYTSALKTESDQAPRHTLYMDILPTKTNSLDSENTHLLWLVNIFLAISLAVVVWVIWHDKKTLKHNE